MSALSASTLFLPDQYPNILAAGYAIVAEAPLAEQERLILSKLGDAEGILQSLQQYTTRIRAAEEEIAKHLQEKQTLEEQRNILQTSLQREQRTYQVLHTTLSAIPIQDTEKEKSSLDAAIEELIAAEAHWKLLYQAINEKDNVVHPAVDLILSELETAHAENETAYTQQLTTYSSINQRCIELKKSIGELEEKLAGRNISL